MCEDTRVTKRLLHLLHERGLLKRTFEAQFLSMHSHNMSQMLGKLDFEMLRNKTVVYLSDAGMPAVSDPGCELVRFAQEHHIDYDVLPGANAALLAYAQSGFCETRFLFYGFLPHKGSDRTDALHEAMYSGYVTIIYESPHRLLKLLEQICNIDAQRGVFLLKEATKKYEQRFKGSVGEIFERLQHETIKGEWVVVLNSDTKRCATITVEDIVKLDLPKKQAAKLIAKITGKPVKQCYHELI